MSDRLPLNNKALKQKCFYNSVLCTQTHTHTWVHMAFQWLTNTAVVVAGQLVSCIALTVVWALGVHTSVHAVVGQGTLVSVCRKNAHTCTGESLRYRQEEASKKSNSLKQLIKDLFRGSAFYVREWLTHTVVSVPLVALRTLAGVGASGVVACLVRAASVSTCRAFIYVCNKHTHTHKNTQTLRGSYTDLMSTVCRNIWQTKQRNMSRLYTLCDLWCVNCFPQTEKSVITDTITSHTWA